MTHEECKKLLSENNISKEELDKIWHADRNYMIKRLVEEGYSWEQMDYQPISGWLRFTLGYLHSPKMKELEAKRKELKELKGRKANEQRR